MKVYSIFSRKSHEDVLKILKSMKVNYVIFEYGWCGKGGKPGCSMPELWDLHDIENRNKTPLCERLNNQEYGPFELVYQNPVYKIFRVS